MLTAKVVCILVIFVSIYCDGEQLLTKFRIARRSQLRNTNMILLLDFSAQTKVNDSIAQFVKGLFEGYQAKDADLRIFHLFIDMVPFKTEWFRYAHFNKAKRYLTGQFNARKRWNSTHKINRFYAAAFSRSSNIFREGYHNDSYRSVVLLITHGKEQCEARHCLNPDSCCNEPCRTCYNKGKKQCQRILSRNGTEVGETDLFVTGDTDSLKKEGAIIITVGIGQEIDQARLKCWATNSDMYIWLTNYTQLPRKGAKEIIDLFETKFPLASSSTKAITATPKSTSGQVKWYWWLIAAISIIIVVLIIVVSVAGAIIYWWKRRKRAVVPIVHLNDGKRAPRYPHKPMRGNSFKPVNTSVCSTLYGGAVKDPNLVMDRTCVQEMKESGDSTTHSTQTTQTARKQATGLDFRPSGKRSAVNRHDKATPNLDSAQKSKPASSKLRKAADLVVAKNAVTVNNVKGLGPANVKDGKRGFQEGKADIGSARGYEIVDPESFDKGLLISHATTTKPLTVPGVLQSDHSEVFRTLK